jgi:hypothetical protein
MWCPAVCSCTPLVPCTLLLLLLHLVLLLLTPLQCQGGVCMLLRRHPHVWGCSLVESPSLWVAEERLLQDVAAHRWGCTLPRSTL